MTRARRVVGPVGIDVPERLPGGVWGAPNTRLNLAWDANGTPSASWRPGVTPLAIALAGLDAPADVVATTTARAEMPWPQPWAVQVGVTISGQPPQPPLAPVEVEFEVTLAVESASTRYVFGVPWSGAQTALLPIDLGSSQAIQFVAQRIQVRPTRLRPMELDPALASWGTTLEIAWLVGLAAPPQVVP